MESKPRPSPSEHPRPRRRRRPRFAGTRSEASRPWTDQGAGLGRKGGVAAHRAGTAHEFNSDEARIAGRKGALATPAVVERMATRRKTRDARPRLVDRAARSLDEDAARAGARQSGHPRAGAASVHRRRGAPSARDPAHADARPPRQRRARGPLRLRVDVRAAREFSDAIFHLLDNAIEATSPGSPVFVDARRLADGDILWQVVDTGRGMEPDALARLGDPRVAGPGRGVALANAVIQEHGGVLRFESAPRVGTTASIWLPAACACG